MVKTLPSTQKTRFTISRARSPLCVTQNSFDLPAFAPLTSMRFCCKVRKGGSNFDPRWTVRAMDTAALKRIFTWARLTPHGPARARRKREKSRECWGHLRALLPFPRDRYRGGLMIAAQYMAGLECSCDGGNRYSRLTLPLSWALLG